MADLPNDPEEVKRLKEAIDALRGAYDGLLNKIDEVTPGFNAFNDEFDDVFDKVNKAEDAIDNAAGAISSFGDAAKKAQPGFSKLISAFGLGQIASDFFKEGVSLLSDLLGTDAVEAAAKQEKGLLKLARGLDAVGDNVELVLPQLAALVDRLEITTGFDDTETTDALNGLARAGFGAVQSQEILNDAIAIAADSGKGLVESTDLIIKAFNGYDGALEKLAATYGVAKDKGNDFNSIISAIREQTAGAATLAVEGNAAASERLSIAWENLSETTGSALLPMFALAADSLVDLISPYEQLVQTSKDQLDAFEQTSSSALELGNEYDSLKSKASLTAVEKERLNSLIKELATVMPGAVNAWNDEGVAIGVNTTAMRAYIEARREVLRAENVETIIGARDAYAKLAERVDEAQKNLTLVNSSTEAQRKNFADYSKTVTTFSNSLAIAQADVTTFVAKLSPMFDTSRPEQFFNLIRQFGPELANLIKVQQDAFKTLDATTSRLTPGLDPNIVKSMQDKLLALQGEYNKATLENIALLNAEEKIAIEKANTDFVKDEQLKQEATSLIRATYAEKRKDQLEKDIEEQNKILNKDRADQERREKEHQSALNTLLQISYDAAVAGETERNTAILREEQRFADTLLTIRENTAAGLQAISIATEQAQILHNQALSDINQTHYQDEGDQLQSAEENVVQLTTTAVDGLAGALSEIFTNVDADVGELVQNIGKSVVQSGFQIVAGAIKTTISNALLKKSHEKVATAQAKQAVAGAAAAVSGTPFIGPALGVAAANTMTAQLATSWGLLDALASTGADLYGTDRTIREFARKQSTDISRELQYGVAEGLGAPRFGMAIAGSVGSLSNTGASQPIVLQITNQFNGDVYDGSGIEAAADKMSDALADQIFYRLNNLERGSIGTIG